MKELAEREGVWFVYDGDCPLCNHAAQALRIKRQFGALHLLNAREAGADHPLIGEINRRQLDIDEGMVIYCRDRFYHGKDALKFMATHGEARGAMNISFKALFQADRLAGMLYPWMRGTRNWLLRRLGVGRIDNLTKRREPIFKPVFGDAWDALPPVMKKHYANRPYTADRVTVEGRLDVMCGGPVRLLKPLILFMGGIPPFNETQVPVTVQFDSEPNRPAFHFNRVFHFRNRKPYGFRSHMLPVGGNELVEIMGLGVGWRMAFVWRDGRVILEHRGYALQWFGHLIPLPLTWLLGRGHAEETAVDDDHFDMFVEMTHPWWGTFYGYKGRFRVTEVGTD